MERSEFSLEQLRIAEVIRLLREKSLLIFGILGASFIAFFMVSERLITRIKGDILPPQANVIAQSPLEAVVVKLQISLVLSFLVVVAAIALLFLKRRGVRVWRASLFLWLAIGLALFALGFTFTYFVLLPTAVDILTGLTLESGILAYYSIGQFIFFIFITTLVFSLVFELPVVTTWLVVNRLVSLGTLKDKRKHIYVGIVVMAALITADPTPVSQLLLSGPLILLYEISIAVSSLLIKRGGGVD